MVYVVNTMRIKFKMLTRIKISAAIKTIVMLLWFSSPITGQDLDYVKAQVDTLASPFFYGRGYVNDGSNLAADYIANEFQELGAQPIGNSFFQPFSFAVNTFPERVRLTCNKKELKAGYDFLIWPSSGSVVGKYKVHSLTANDFSKKLPALKSEKHIPVVDLSEMGEAENENFVKFRNQTLAKKPVIILNSNKMMWTVGRQQHDNAIVEVEKDKFCNRAKKVELEIENVEVVYEARNVIGKIAGHSSDSSFVFTAHYDHLGMMGDAVFRGASDNASGTAMLLDLIKYYSKNKPAYDIYFIAFAAEEAGLIGSKFFVDHPTFDLSTIKFLINLDLMGSAAEGIGVVNGSLFPERMKIMERMNEENGSLFQIKLRGKAANSDHYWFSEAGVPAIFIYTMGNVKAYHDVHDVPNGLDWANYNELFSLIVGYLRVL